MRREAFAVGGVGGIHIDIALDIGAGLVGLVQRGLGVRRQRE